MIDTGLVERFTNPPPEYGPTPLWWWSGGTVTEEGIDAQLQSFVDGGIVNLVLMNLAPKGPTYGAMPDDPVWFSERWWELFRHTCDRARQLGVKLWFYDQIGFSGANLQGIVTGRHPEASGQALRSRTTVTGADGEIDLDPAEHVLLVVDDEGDPEAGWQRHDLDGTRVVGARPGSRLRIVSWRETAFDYLNPTSVGWLLDLVHGEYERRVPEHLGSTIVGSFQDELPAMPTWSTGFATRFLAETGYDLLPVLPALWDRSHPESARIRSDYHRVRTILAEEAFFRPLGEWHRERGMLIGADQMNPARAGLPTQSTQLYGDYFATHRWFDAVGSDHEGDARVHSSMADLYDHPRVWIESFHSSGWGGTLEETWDWLIPFFRSGANLYNPHASYYGLQAGWFEWAPPSTDFRQPYYEVYPSFARAVARVSALLTWGRHAVDVALLHPTTAVQSVLSPDLPIDHFSTGDVGPEYPGADAAQRSYLALSGKNDWFRSAPGLLDRASIDFDVVDDESLVRAQVRDGAAHVNGFGFRTVILPEMSCLAAPVAERLLELLDAGGRVIVVGPAPERAAGGWRADDEERDAVVRRLAEHPGLELAEDPEAVVRALDDLPRFAAAANGVRARWDGDLALALVPGAFPNATAYPLRKTMGSNAWDDIDFDARRYAGSQELRVVGTVVEAELWNPATGARAPASFRPGPEESTIAVEGMSAPLLVAVWRTAPPGEEVPDAIPVRSDGVSASEVTTRWTQELVPTLDNRAGDFALPAGPADIPLELWQLDLVEEGRRTPVRVTFGQELLVTGAFPAATDDPISPDRAAAVRDGAALGDEGWVVQRYSTSYGRDGSAGVSQDPKGFVEEGFFVHQTPAAGEEVGLRALVRVEEPGELDLSVSSACAVQAWLDGEELVPSSLGYDDVFPVRFHSTTAVLELRILARPPTGRAADGRIRALMTGSFTLSRPGSRVPRPEFMAPGPGGAEDGVATFRHGLELEHDASAVRVVTGSPTALTVVVDGRPVARQEKVEYYESGRGDDPMYFTHEVGPVAAGRHELEVITERVADETPLFVDLVAETAQGLVALPSGHGWTVGPQGSAAVLVPARSGGTTHARAARRPHPLAAAHWLSGPPEVGDLSVPFETSASARARAETFEATLPAGTVAVELTADPASVTVDGRVVTLTGREAALDVPTDEPTRLTVTLPPRSFSTSGAAWAGPLVVRTAPTPAIFSDWSEQGLGSWSGAVRYSTSVDVDAGETLRLTLGPVRGAVTLDVDGERAGDAFCAPFVFFLDELSAGPHELAVTVYGTLGPRYASATQSTFFAPSQLRTGLAGPIRVERLRQS